MFPVFREGDAVDPATREGGCVINLATGKEVEVDGRVFVKTEPGKSGHAIYGPYVAVDPGYYAAEFVILMGESEDSRNDKKFGIVDVACNSGNKILSCLDIHSKYLRTSPVYRLVFGTQHRIEDVEFRVFVNGSGQLLIGPTPFSSTMNFHLSQRRRTPRGAASLVRREVSTAGFSSEGASRS